MAEQTHTYIEADFVALWPWHYRLLNMNIGLHFQLPCTDHHAELADDTTQHHNGILCLSQIIIIKIFIIIIIMLDIDKIRCLTFKTVLNLVFLLSGKKHTHCAA
jgi:hypothetical protein